MLIHEKEIIRDEIPQDFFIKRLLELGASSDERISIKVVNVIG